MDSDFNEIQNYVKPELKSIAIELIRYCRYEPFEKTCTQLDQEIFDDFMRERIKQ